MLLEHLSFPQVERLPRDLPILIPFGSVEEHGPHLPLATDVYTIYRVAELASRSLPLLVAPPVYYGLCRSTSDHPGTVSLRGETLRALALDLLRGFRRQGFRFFVLASGHAGGTHMAFLLDAGETFLAEDPEVRVAVVSILDLLRECAADLVETPDDSHAGEWETALIQFFYPDLVGEPPEAEYPAFPRHLLVPEKRRFWPGGVWGDPRRASPEKGERLARRLAEGLKSVIKNLVEAGEGR